MPAERLGDIRKYQMRAPLTVVAYALDDETEIAQGQLTLIDNQVDETTGTIRLKAQFDNDGEPLWPDESVNAHLVLTIEDNAVTVPPQTVMHGPNGAYVYVLDDNDTAHRRDVAVAETQQGYSVIANGLAAGDRVVVEGQHRLTDGAKARTGEARPGAVAQKSAL